MLAVRRELLETGTGVEQLRAVEPKAESVHTDQSFGGVAMTEHADHETAVRYEFLMHGIVAETVLSAFPELSAAKGPAGGTVLFGAVYDDAHLHGLLARFQTFGLTLLEMRRLPD